MTLSDEKIVGQYLAAAGVETKSGSAAVYIETAEIESRGWRFWYRELYGEKFVEVLADHHIDAIEWHWNARLALLRGEKPDYWAYFPIWPRGHMKSATARRIAVMDAVISSAAGQPAYILYVSRNKEMAVKHALSIESMLSSAEIKKYCPGISEVKKNEKGSSKGWKATFLNTAAGAVFHFGGLDEGLAGGNIDDVRPTLIVPDDIDGREDSDVISESRFNKLTSEVLPMRQHNTLTFYAQNLISRWSVQYRIHSGKARVLTNRKPTEPVPAVLDLITETRTVNGIVQDVITGGRPTWDYYNLERCQEEINTIGLEAFLRECMHEVERSRAGLIAKNYVDAVHVISESEFAAVYGTGNEWKKWAKWNLNDWARTKTERHANVAGWLAVSSQNTAFPGATFLARPLSFPAESEPEDVAERLLSCLTPYAYNRVTWAEVRRDAHLRLNADLHARTFSERIKFEREHLSKIIPQYSRPILKGCQVKGGVMGHSDEHITRLYREVYGLQFLPVNPGKHGGIEEINHAMKIDWTIDHPFRPGVKGYTRWFVIAPDDKSDPAPREEGGRKIYRPKEFPAALRPDELHDSDLFRYQMMNWRYREATLSATGETIDEPLKINDDYGQMLQMAYSARIIKNIPLNSEEKLYEAIAPETRILTKKKNLSMGEQMALMDEVEEKQKILRRERDPRLHSLGRAENNGSPNLKPSQIIKAGAKRQSDVLPAEEKDENGFGF